MANNAALTSANNKPTFTGDGFEVGTQWRYKDGRPMPPHLFYNSGALALGACYTPPGTVTFDSWNSADGDYGPDNMGGEPTMLCGPDAPPMPTVTLPEGLPGWPGPVPAPAGTNNNVVFTGTVTISSSFQCRNLDTNANTILNIATNSNIKIRARTIMLGQFTTIKVPTTSTLTIYFTHGMTIGRWSELNYSSPMNPARLWIKNWGNQNLTFARDTKVVATIVSPNGHVHFDQNDQFFGTMAAASMSMDQNAGFHWDGIPKFQCTDLVADIAGVSDGPSSGAITSASTFNQWFNNVLGVNLAAGLLIPLKKNASDIYEYSSAAFFPIDGILFGNEGDAHNYNFTFTFSATFEYVACAGSFFSFRGSDDAWVYINGKHAIDLGGVMPLERQVIEMDRLELEPGKTYTLHFYYAQRNPYMSVFEIETDLELESVGLPSATAPYD